METHCSNLPFKCEKADIEAVFKQFGVLNEIVVPRKGEEAGPAFLGYLSAYKNVVTLWMSFEMRGMRGSAFFSSETFPAAVKALKTQNMKEIKGRPVAIDWAVPKDDFVTAAEEEKKSESASQSGGPKESKESVAVKIEVMDEDMEEEVKPEPSSSHTLQVPKEESDEESVSEEGRSGSEDDDQEDLEESGPSKDGVDEIKKKREPDPGLTEGRTLFLRNLSFDTTDDDLKECFAKFGELRYAIVCKYADTEHSKGSGFVQFVEKESAEKCLAASEVEHPDGSLGFKLDKRRVIVCRAIERGKAKEMESSRHQKQPKDKRNLHLLRIGLIRQGTKEAGNMSQTDALKRVKMEQQKRQKIKNLHVFVSSTRLCIHNLPTTLEDRKLEVMCLEAVGDETARLKECRVMRDMDRVTKKGRGKSRGFAFVEFSEHRHALACLQKLNNNPSIFTDTKRPIVEFSLENKTALNKKAKRLDKSRAKIAALKGELPKKKPRADAKSEPGGFGEKKASDVDETKKMVAAGGRKPLPSHLGPKIRHKPRKGDGEKKSNLGKSKKRKIAKKSRAEKRKEKFSDVDQTSGKRKLQSPRKHKVMKAHKKKKQAHGS